MVNIIALGIILILVLIFIIIGIAMMKSKKPVQYLANTDKIPNVKDIKGYNKAIGKIFIIFALLTHFITCSFICSKFEVFVFVNFINTFLGDSFDIMLYFYRE